VVLRLGAAFLLLVVFLRRVVFLLRAGARRRDVDLRAAVFLLLVVVFLLAIVLPPDLERVLALRLLVFLRLAALLLAARLLAGLRGFKITTSDNGMVLKQPERRLWYKGVVGVYVGVIQNSLNSEDTPRYMGGSL
jgi:protein-S-isoprenylcysteine O-methyltransferase Ste14